jgi:ribonuclease HI
MKNEEEKSKAKGYWEPPPRGWLKVNIDGSFVQETENGATGVVIRDHMGHTILAGGSIITKCPSAEEAEATALLDGCRLAMNRTKQPIIFESDCLTLVNSIHRKNDCQSKLRSFVSDFLHNSSNFPGWKCMFVKRE